MIVFWAILKGIGWVFLGLLSFLLGCVLLVLLVPLRYRAEGTYQGRFSGKAKVTWLLHLVTAEVAFADQVSYRVRILGICLLPKKEKKISKKAAKKEVEQAAKETAQAVGEAAEQYSKAEMGPKEEKVQETGQGQENGAGTALPPQGEDGPLAGVAGAKDGHTEPPGSFEERLKRVWEAVRLFLEKLVSQYGQLRSRLQKLGGILSYYMKILQREETKQLCVLVFSQLKNMLRSVLPKKLSVRLCIGTKNSASVGQVMALYGMLYPVLGDQVAVFPDFEEEHVEAGFALKGRITVCMLVFCMLRIVLNRNFRLLIRILRKKEEA